MDLSIFRFCPKLIGRRSSVVRPLKLLGFYLFLLLFCNLSFAEDYVVSNGEVTVTSALTFSLQNVKRAESLDFDQFRPYANEQISGQHSWYRFDIETSSRPTDEYYLQAMNTPIKEFEVWTNVGTGWQQVIQHGVNGSLALNHNTRPDVRLPNSKGVVKVLVRIHSLSSYKPEMRILTETELSEFSIRTLVSESLGLGALFALALYALIVFGVSRDIRYFWLSLYCVFNVVFLSHHLGYAFWLFGGEYAQAAHSLAVVASFPVFGSFVILSLLTLEVTPNRFIWMGCAMLQVMGIVLFVQWIPEVYLLGTVLGGLAAMSITPFALYRAFRGQRLAWQFFLANTASFIGGSAVWATQVLGGERSDLSYAVMMLGTVCTGLLLILLLGTRIRKLRMDGEMHLRQELLARRDAEDAQALAATKSAFLATMSHEIRTPMNGVLGMAAILEDTNLDSSQRQYIETLSRSGQLLISILDDILDYSKFETGNLKLECLEIDLMQLIDDAVVGLKHVALTSDTQLLIEFHPSAPEYTLGDSTRLRQIVSNLLSNAIKFTDEGHISLSIEVVDGWLEIAVTDAGIGISEDKLAHLFDRFSQADDSITRRFGGTGLGLAICKLLAEAMGGDINVASKVGVGSTFTLRIPAETVTKPVQKPKPKVLEVKLVGSATETHAIATLLKRWGVMHNPEALGIVDCADCPSLQLIRSKLFDHDTQTLPVIDTSRALANTRILVAEDNQTNQIVVRKMLERMGAEVKLVENGDLAVSAVTDENFDIVLMDCEMPVKDGYAAAREIRRLDTPEADIPIMALTAHATDEYRQLAKSAGMNSYLTKPLSQKELLKSIQGLVQP